MGATIKTILQSSFDDYLKSHRLPLYVHKAARVLMACRTAALGGHVLRCRNGHLNGVWYNSCRHRSCPQCAWTKIDEWLEAKKGLLLEIDHYHVIFTLPHQLLPLWRWNRKVLADLLFRCAADTLFTLLEDTKYLGAKPGILISLHTWSRTLVLHPHVHCLVSGGGLCSRGSWKGLARKDILLPAKVVRQLFTGMFQGRLEALIKNNRITLPPDLTQHRALKLLKRAGRKKWNLRVGKRYEHGRGVATYLARYVRGGAVKNRQIVSFDERGVTYRYKDRETNKIRIMTLCTETFLSRLFEHIPVPGQRVVRSYGLYHHYHRQTLDRCRELLPEAPDRDPQPEASVEEADEGPASSTPSPCEVCGLPLYHVEIPRGGAPPPDISLEKVA